MQPTRSNPHSESRAQLAAQLRPALQGKRILLGITGSIAAFKACDIVRLLKDCGAEVRCVMTESAGRFVSPLTLENLSGERVCTSLWGDGAQGTHHIDAARWADLALIAPATANSIGKLAQGLADDLLSTELLAFRGPVLVAPAMNPAMYEHPAVQANLAALASREATIVGPTHGLTSCGERGEGRMLEPEAIVECVARAFYSDSTHAAYGSAPRLTLTLGPTRSRIDPVRYLTNRSSGLMGAAIAWAARRAGYEVTVIAGPTQALLPSDARVLRVQTASEMLEAASREFERSDVFVSAAAVLDWEITEPATQKLKKEDGPPRLEFVKAPDILATLCARKRAGQFVLGFAAETGDAVAEGAQKRLRKGCDALFANDVSLDSHGFESSQNGGWWIGPTEIFELPPRPKTELAAAIVELIDRASGRRPNPDPRGPTEGLHSRSPLSAPHPEGDSRRPSLARPDDARVV